MPLTGLAADVTKAMVGVLLIERDSDLLNRTYGDPESPVFDAIVRQITAEVIPVAGANPTGATRELALQCIAYGVASSIEYSEFPEQQNAGNIGRGYFLKLKFNDLLATLRGMPKNGTDAMGTGASRGKFPPPMPYPDPIRQPGPRRYI